MITYELAKQLKDAGFPQGIGFSDKYYCFTSHPRMGINPQWAVNTRISALECPPLTEDQCKIPTLSELIEACGLNFKYLGLKEDRNTWITFSHYDPVIAQEGSTPEEAVAKLWLAINEK